MNDLFVDRLGNVVIANGVARLDFLRLQAGQDGKKLEMEPSLRVALPVAELPRVIAMLENIRNELQKQQAATQESPLVSAAPS
jgi:hypothetical protein